LTQTGGASGIGLGICNHFGSQGNNHHIAILDIHASAPPDLLPALSKDHASATFSYHQCDISSWDSVAAAFAAVHETCGRIDIVMANAGISREESLIPSTLPTAESAPPTCPQLRTMDVNFTGALYTTKLAIHYLLLNSPTQKPARDVSDTTETEVSSRGTIILTASNAGIYPFPVAPLYGATKAAVVNLTRSLGPALLPHGIQINALAPAVLETNIAPSKDLFQGMIITPMSTLQRAVGELVADPSRTGQVVEVHGASATIREPQPYVDADSEANLNRFWNLGYA
jgi:NAD(P)-dependent dehydrogenase (short-subunit alcohol dehydrogenase family)